MENGSVGRMVQRDANREKLSLDLTGTRAKFTSRRPNALMTTGRTCSAWIPAGYSWWTTNPISNNSCSGACAGKPGAAATRSSSRAQREALFFSELEARAAELGGVSITRFDSGTGARIDTAVIEDDLDGALSAWNYYLCGPKSMIDAVSFGLTRRGVPARSIHTEEFELR